MTNINNILPNELRHIVWEQLSVRPPLQANIKKLHKFLQYELGASELGENIVNEYRDKIIRFIADHKDQLSLPCDGNCYTHSDGIVISCYQQLLEDTDGDDTEID